MDLSLGMFVTVKTALKGSFNEDLVLPLSSFIHDCSLLLIGMLAGASKWL